MAPGHPPDRPLPTLLLLLIGSFILMLLSGISYMAGLPEDLARALFLATVIVWFSLGIAVLVKGRLEVRDLERERAARVSVAKGASTAQGETATGSEDA